jgi:FhuF 2Fe-2S C-terminal domain
VGAAGGDGGDRASRAGDVGVAAGVGVPPVRVFADEPALLDAAAAAAVATLAPLLREVRANTRFGLVPLWNAAGDAVRLTAEMAPRYSGRAPRPGLAAALLDALVAHGAPIRGRGQDQPLPGLPERVPVRAACCLAFRTDPPVTRASDALCTTCPLLAAPERARRYTAWLDRLPPVTGSDPAGR